MHAATLMRPPSSAAPPAAHPTFRSTKSAPASAAASAAPTPSLIWLVANCTPAVGQRVAQRAVSTCNHWARTADMQIVCFCTCFCSSSQADQCSSAPQALAMPLSLLPPSRTVRLLVVCPPQHGPLLAIALEQLPGKRHLAAGREAQFFFTGGMRDDEMPAPDGTGSASHLTKAVIHCANHAANHATPIKHEKGRPRT